MRSVASIMLLSLYVVATGCVTKPVVLPAIGPNPHTTSNPAVLGELEVYSTQEARSEGDGD
jgi:hypothetical protein